MLFDLRGSGRRRTVQVIYAALALLMGGGLVFFGVGGSVGGGLLDAVNGNGTSSSDTFAKTANALQKRADLHPTDASLWVQLARARYQDATTGDGVDQTSGTFTDKGKVKLRQAGAAWDRYLALNPKKPDDQVANLMVQGFGPSGLNELTQATTAMEIVVDARPKSYALYAQLAQLAYLAGETRKGDLSSAKAVALAPKDQRNSVKSTLSDVKNQAAQAAVQSATTTATASP